MKKYIHIVGRMCFENECYAFQTLKEKKFKKKKVLYFKRKKFYTLTTYFSCRYNLHYVDIKNTSLNNKV